MPFVLNSSSCGAGSKAKEVYDSLVDEADFRLPNVDLDSSQYVIPPTAGNVLYNAVDRVTLEQLTNRTIGGTGVFDAMMEVTGLHLKKEFEAQRISGREYAEVYTASLQAAMGQAVQFLMGKDQAYWQAIMVQAQARRAEIEAVTARVDLERAKLELLAQKATTLTHAADYGLKKMQLSIADVDYCIRLAAKEAAQLEIEEKVYTNLHMLPLQKAHLEHQNDQITANISGITKDNEMKTFRMEFMLPVELETARSMMESASVDRDMKRFQMSDILPWQAKLTREQAESARAQTSNTRSDGSPVMGMLGKQKDLYSQQIIAYKKDAESKVAKMFMDSWMAHQAIFEDLDSPDVLTKDSIQEILLGYKTSNPFV